MSIKVIVMVGEVFGLVYAEYVFLLDSRSRFRSTFLSSLKGQERGTFKSLFGVFSHSMDEKKMLTLLWAILRGYRAPTHLL